MQFFKRKKKNYAHAEKEYDEHYNRFNGIRLRSFLCKLN